MQLFPIFIPYIAYSSGLGASCSEGKRRPMRGESGLVVMVVVVPVLATMTNSAPTNAIVSGKSS